MDKAEPRHTTELRARPFYRAFASDDLADELWYGLSAGERGVLHSMQHACWVNGSVPRSPRLLARAIRLDESDVRTHLTTNVLRHFVEDPADASRLCHPELRRQLAEVELTRQRQSLGGKKGANLTNQKRRNAISNYVAAHQTEYDEYVEYHNAPDCPRLITPITSDVHVATPASTPAPIPATPLQVSDTNRSEATRTASIGKTVITPELEKHTAWILEYEEEERKQEQLLERNRYQVASRGE